MTSIVAVSSSLPDTIPIARFQRELGLTDVQLRRYQRFYGLSEVCRAPEATETELLLRAAAKLVELRGQEQRVKYVLQARTMASPLPYPMTSLGPLLAELGLEHATAFVVAHHACASGLLAVDMAGTLLAADPDPDALALVLTGEKARTGKTQSIPDVTVMGEGTAAVLVSADRTGRDRMLGYAARTHPRFGADFIMGDAAAKDFQDLYGPGLTEVIGAALDEAGCTLGELALVLPHNVNRLSWIGVCKELGLPPERVFLDLVPHTGHCFCADPFINLQHASELGRLRPGDRYLMTSVGLGATFAAMVLEH
ncbi:MULTISPECIES: 3-oxoacyl-[acyl-carrier-protein] synthase III C-terminal domain-containing protein [unclassified Streptomyces]|uniref:3-oxoacyl-[acyl-carrier-protein] synthase III C-terminal domain-containing protein n=1 Tax=unclassified Streptomyces TaxID=2593676 RepID=UPI0036CFD35B